MPVIYTGGAAAFDSIGNKPFDEYNSAADNFIYFIAQTLFNLGWAAVTHYPRFTLTMPIDMSPFLITGGTDQAVFWVISPVDPSLKPLLIVDDLRGFTNPDGWDVVITGTLDADICIDAIAQGLCNMGAPNGYEIKIVAKYNHGLASRYYVMEVTYPLVGTPPFIHQMIGHSGPGVAHNANVTTLSGNGGYSLTSARNGASSPCSFFLGRTTDVDGSNNKGPPYIILARNADNLPDSDILKPSEQGNGTVLGTLFSSYSIAASELTFFMKETSPSHTGHIEMGSVTPLNDINGNFMVVAGESFLNDSFREGPNCNGTMLLQKSGEYLYTSNFGFFTPRVMTLWSLDNIGTLWENGLGAILEPRIAFAIDESKIAGIVGSIPYCIIVHKSFLRDSVAFLFDEIAFRPYTENTTSSNGSALGTLCFGTQETPDPLTCTVG